MLSCLQPTWQPISIREGCEPDEFWEALGGRSEYPKEKDNIKQMEDPHLFKVTVTDGRQ